MYQLRNKKNSTKVFLIVKQSWFLEISIKKLIDYYILLIWYILNKLKYFGPKLNIFKYIFNPKSRFLNLYESNANNWAKHQNGS